MVVYLDHAATTPLRPEARAAWLDVSDTVGNPSSVHRAGQAARRILEDARERLAGLVGCEPIELVFTSGGTESVNLALKGLWWSRESGTDTLVLPAGEHHATLDTVEWLQDHEGARVAAVPLDDVARIDAGEFARSVSASGIGLATALVANNEAGTINDVVSLAGAAASAGVPLHLDAVGAFGHIPVDFAGWRGTASGPAGLVALSLSAHKLGGPIGTGALVLSRHASATPILHGGGQQRGLRSGTQDAAGAAAFAVAAELAVTEQQTEASRLSVLRDRLVGSVVSRIPGSRLLGDPVGRLPGNAHLLFPGASGESLLFLLDQEGLAVSTGSACQAGTLEPSHVVLAMGLDPESARSVLRVTLGRETTDSDVDALLAALPAAVERARAAGAGLQSRP